MPFVHRCSACEAPLDAPSAPCPQCGLQRGSFRANPRRDPPPRAELMYGMALLRDLPCAPRIAPRPAGPLPPFDALNPALVAPHEALGPDAITRALPHGLRAVVAAHHDDTLAYVVADDLGPLGLTIAALWDRALVNLAARAPEVERDRLAGGATVVRCRAGLWSASLVLVPGLAGWLREQIGAPSLRVRVPHRDVLIAYPADAEAAVAWTVLREERAYAEAPLVEGAFALDDTGLREA